MVYMKTYNRLCVQLIHGFTGMREKLNMFYVQFYYL
jgi:hypothetical protein